MAKTARKKSVAKARKAKGTKAKGAKAKTKTKIMTKAKSKTSVRKAQPKGIAGRVASAYHTVVDTIKDTGALRNKMEPPGTSETE